MFKKILPYLVLLAAIGQVVAAATISIDAFTGDTYNGLLTLIQPAPFVFAIWGVIYLLSFVYAVYQVIPANNNVYLSHNRPYALFGFVMSGVWLYVAGLDATYVWLTVPILISIAYAFFKAVTPTVREPLSKWRMICSHYALFPYAAWAAIAWVVNVHSIVNQYGLVPNKGINLLVGIFLLGIIAGITLRTLRYVSYSPWYGLVILWASFGIVYANIEQAQGSFLIALFAVILMVIVEILMVKNRKK